MDTTIPTWGYRPNGDARIFDLAPGQALPEGWEASPACITDPSLASADALTARAAGREYVPPKADPKPLPASAAAAQVEIDRLQGIIDAGMAENQRLFEELDAAEAACDAAIAEAATARLAHEHTITSLDAATQDLDDLKAVLTKAQADGGFAVSERDAALADLDTLQAELAQARADLDVATAPAAPKVVKAGK